MTEYLIAFNEEWVPEHTDEELLQKSRAGLAVVDVADEDAARLWAGKIALACGWPQEVHRFQVPMQLPENP